MATETPKGGSWPPINALYGVGIRASIASGDLSSLKQTLAEAEAQNREYGDIRSALAVARGAYTKLKKGA